MGNPRPAIPAWMRRAAIRQYGVTGDLDWYQCWLCHDYIWPEVYEGDSRLGASMDHVIPWSQVANNPRHQVSNLRPAHRLCNTTRRTRPIPGGRVLFLPNGLLKVPVIELVDDPNDWYPRANWLYRHRWELVIKLRWLHPKADDFAAYVINGGDCPACGVIREDEPPEHAEDCEFLAWWSIDEEVA